MKNVFVATDLSDRSDRAMDRAALIAKQMNAILHIVHVVDDEVSATIALAREESATVDLERQVNERPMLKGVDTKIHVEFGHPWKIITQIANYHKAELVVLGTHRNSGLRGLFSGTTLDRVAKSCKSPLIVAVDDVTEPYKSIVVGVDFSESAQYAAEIASRLSQMQSLTLVHAYHYPLKALTKGEDEEGDDSSKRTRVEAAKRVRMSDFVRTLNNPQGEIHEIIKEGGTVTVLKSEITSRKADLVCVGSHSKSWLVEAVLGSTAHELLTYPPCDVLVAPLR